MNCPNCNSGAVVETVDGNVCVACGWGKEALLKARQNNRMSLTRRRKKDGKG